MKVISPPIKKIKLLFFLIRFFSPHFLVLLLFHIIYIFGLCSPFPPYFQFLSCVYIYFFTWEKSQESDIIRNLLSIVYVSPPKCLILNRCTNVLAFPFIHTWFKFSFPFFFSADNWQKHWQGCCCVHNYRVFFKR